MKTIFHHIKLNDIFTMYLGIKVEPFQCVDCMRVFCYIVSHETSNSTEKAWSLYHSFEIGIVKTLKKLKIWKSIRPNLANNKTVNLDLNVNVLYLPSPSESPFPFPVLKGGKNVYPFRIGLTHDAYESNRPLRLK